MAGLGGRGPAFEEGGLGGRADREFASAHGHWSRLGLRPRRRVPFVTEIPSGGFSVELPIDLDAIPVHAAVPGTGLPFQGFEIRDSSDAETLPGEDADFDFRLIEPASVSWCVVDREAVPYFAADLLPVEIRQGLDAMDIQVIHHKVDGPGLRILNG
jgi:hypothetical protein